MENAFHANHYKVLASTHEKRLCYSKGRMWLEDKNHNISKVKVKLSKLSRLRIAERILRLTPRLGFAICGEFFFSLHGWLFCVDESNMEAREVFQFRPGMSNPLTVCKAQWNQQEVVCWGEYWQNSAHEEVNVFRFDGNLVTKACTIAGIKHIHLIVWDQYRDCFWITTGDSDDESRIYRASCDFNNLEIVFSGRQIYRTCALFPVEKGIIYATDSPLCSNSLLFSEQQKDQFLEPVAIASMPGPCIFSQEFRDTYYFSTSVEPNPNLPTIKYMLSRKISPGNTDEYSHVIGISRDLEVREIFKAAKDIYNLALFQFGNIQLSYDAYADALAAYCTSVKKIDGQTLYLSDAGKE